MGIFSNILSKIMTPAHENKEPVQNSSSAAAPSSTQATSIPTTNQPVDVEAVLKDLAVKSGMKLNYQTSIVDLMKLLNLDSSLDSRRKLADELNYTGDKNNTEAMNIWLIKQLYGKIGENGGHVPQDWKV
ncbi:DUF3597 domain-containing protein [Acetobacteraceae bacterium ESL0709]|nr:DUF3597 domain-containing protein [Acetobacteraceae bacterium ESL0697]MDF7677147.1 DUF3597 domain-containing protein [Acetobacteraceae bacterium ESL0709]MDF7677154.1 DUF3597 domain-containing protein [Acetobacteraceae bacterium ESL0709]